jgi:hypothetical protein
MAGAWPNAFWVTPAASPNSNPRPVRKLDTAHVFLMMLEAVAGLEG